LQFTRERVVDAKGHGVSLSEESATGRVRCVYYNVCSISASNYFASLSLVLPFCNEQTLSEKRIFFSMLVSLRAGRSGANFKFADVQRHTS